MSVFKSKYLSFYCNNILIGEVVTLTLALAHDILKDKIIGYSHWLAVLSESKNVPIFVVFVYIYHTSLRQK